MPKIGLGQWTFDTADIAAIRHGRPPDEARKGRPPTAWDVYLKSGQVLELTEEESEILADHLSGTEWAPRPLTPRPPASGG